MRSPYSLFPPSPFPKRFIRWSMISLLVMSQPHALGQDANDKRHSSEFEKCANACRIELDRSILKCDGYRKPTDPEAPPDCRRTFWEKYDKCAKACPVGTPRQ